MLFPIVLAAFLASSTGVPEVHWPTATTSVTITSANRYRVTRLRRTPSELAQRARDITAMFHPARPDPARLLRWATIALDQEAQRWMQVHPLPVQAPGLVVMYQPLYDDFMIMDLELLHATPDPHFGPEPVEPDFGIGEAASRLVMEGVVADLERRGITASGFSPASGRLGVFRERQRSEKGVAEWVMEYQWTMNRTIDGVEFVDAGIRVGIHRSGQLSSLRITDVGIEPDGRADAIAFDAHEAREIFIMAEKARHPSASIHVERERVAIVLDPDDDTALLEPTLLFNYALRFEDVETGTASASRQMLTTVSLTSGAVHRVFPIPSTD